MQELKNAIEHSFVIEPDEVITDCPVAEALGMTDRHTQDPGRSHERECINSHWTALCGTLRSASSGTISPICCVSVMAMFKRRPSTREQATPACTKSRTAGRPEGGGAEGALTHTLIHRRKRGGGAHGHEGTLYRTMKPAFCS